VPESVHEQALEGFEQNTEVPFWEVSVPDSDRNIANCLPFPQKSVTFPAMKAATLRILVCCVLTCAAQPKPKRSTLAGIAPDDCNQTFAGSARKAVKLRKASDGSTYTKVDGGNAISVADWFTMTCALDQTVGIVPPSMT
jgi:hypothetical protein